MASDIFEGDKDLIVIASLVRQLTDRAEAIQVFLDRHATLAMTNPVIPAKAGIYINDSEFGIYLNRFRVNPPAGEAGPGMTHIV